jgi:hypothetical protein
MSNYQVLRRILNRNDVSVEFDKCLEETEYGFLDYGEVNHIHGLMSTDFNDSITDSIVSMIYEGIYVENS